MQTSVFKTARREAKKAAASRLYIVTIQQHLVKLRPRTRSKGRVVLAVGVVPCKSWNDVGNLGLWGLQLPHSWWVSVTDGNYPSIQMPRPYNVDRLVCYERIDLNGLQVKVMRVQRRLLIVCSCSCSTNAAVWVMVA